MSRALADAELPRLTPDAIAAAGRGLPVRFLLDVEVTTWMASPAVPAGERCVLRIDQMLRLLPGRRLVARVEVAGRPCLLKLFQGRGSDRYRRREVRGCRLLTAAGVATPRMLAEVADPEGQARGLLFEFIQDGQPITDRHPGQTAAVAAAAAQLAKLHAFGAWHGDLHLNNFLYQERADGSRIYVVDGDAVHGRRGHRLSVPASVRNLALLCAQRPPLLDTQLPEILRAYSLARGWPAAGGEFRSALGALREATQRQRRQRVRRYLKKSQRACTEFYCRREFRRFFVCLRTSLDDSFKRFAVDPERFFQGAEMLKDGNSATVVRTRIGERSFVVKRYNVKGFWHGLRRVLKPRARFRMAWCNGQRLSFLDVPTARPVALLERRFGPLRGLAYLVMEDAGRVDLSALASAHGLSDQHLNAIVRVFCSLKAAGLTHGDTKASNFLVSEGEIVVVDLDAMNEGPGQARDIARFLANWNTAPELRQRFCESFVNAGLPVPD